MALIQRSIGFAHTAEVVDFAKAPIARPALSTAERRKREDAVRFANASVGLEGFRVTPEAEARAQRFVSGEIDLAEFLQGQ